MPRLADKLTDIAIRRARPGPKVRKLADGRGLYLELTPEGARRWRWKYRVRVGERWIEKRLSLGTFPDVSLSQARGDRDVLIGQLKGGADPSEARRAVKVEAAVKRQAERDLAEAESRTLEKAAREWFKHEAAAWAPSHASRVIRRLDCLVLPHVGGKALATVTRDDLLEVLRRIEGENGVETARRVRVYLAGIFERELDAHHIDRDVVPPVRLLARRPRTEHMASTTDPDELGRVLMRLREHRGTPVVGAALLLLPRLFCRPGELRAMRWEDVDFDRAEWRFTLSKTHRPHIVPLSGQAVAILRGVEPLTGREEHVFPGERSRRRPISENAIGYAMKDLGIPAATITPHGWRAAARTLIVERLGGNPEVVERQLGHATTERLGAAYDRTIFLDQRRVMMQTWADYLEELERSAS